MAVWCRWRTPAKARRSSGIRLLEFTTPKHPIVPPAGDELRVDRRNGPGGVRDDPDRPLEAGCERERAHRARVDDEPGRVLEHEARERKLLRARLPERRDALVEDAVAEQAADDAVLAFHGVEVAVTVAPPHRHPRDEMVQHEVVQDDDSGPLAKPVDDPGVRVRVVADVVERDVGPTR